MNYTKKYYTVTDISSLFKVHRMTVIRWIRKGLIKGFRFHPKGKYFFDSKEVVDILSKGI